MTTSDGRCESCEWWDKETMVARMQQGGESAQIEAVCRRMPANEIRKPKDWCGEYKAAQPAEKPVIFGTHGVMHKFSTLDEFSAWYKKRLKMTDGGVGDGTSD